MMNFKRLNEELKIGLIQTTVDDRIAWPVSNCFKMSNIAQDKAWNEIKKGFKRLETSKEKPKIIILPELTLPTSKQIKLINLAKSAKAVIIAGLDFVINNNRVRNEAVVLVPNNWPKDIPSTHVNIIRFGKTFFSREEYDLQNKINLLNGKSFVLESYKFMHIFNAGAYGNIGVAICSDFFDLERFVMYRGNIHHMIVIAHNRDTTSFYCLAEAIARLVYCNVIVCNTGFFGGSYVFSPYKNSNKRVIYNHEGNDLFTTQIINVPVYALDNAQNGLDIISQEPIFKSPPPGYRTRIKRTQAAVNLNNEEV